MVKYKDEIMSRPRKEWFVGRKRRNDVKEDSKGDLKNIRSQFESTLDAAAQDRSARNRKRNKKAAEKEAQKAGGTKFSRDAEPFKKHKNSKFSEQEARAITKKKFFKKLLDKSGKQIGPNGTLC